MTNDEIDSNVPTNIGEVSTGGYKGCTEYDGPIIYAPYADLGSLNDVEDTLTELGVVS